MRMMAPLLLFQICCWLILSLSWTAEACKCLQPTLEWTFPKPDVVILQATLLRQIKLTAPSSPLEIGYSARIIRAWKGCSNYKGITTTTITTTTEGASCGVLFLKLRTPYLFSGYLDSTNKSLAITSCGFQSLWSNLNASEVASLSANYTDCACTPKSCGPKRANVLCPDGVTASGPRSCSYNPAQDKCAWDNVKCPTCQSQSDCLKGQFCSAGKCRAIGTCASVIDCWNEGNLHDIPCAGAPRCKNSKCFFDCSRPCPNGASLVKCFADPCTVTSCKVPNVSCASNYCGGCHAIFYNSSGYQVCTKKS